MVCYIYKYRTKEAMIDDCTFKNAKTKTKSQSAELVMY